MYERIDGGRLIARSLAAHGTRRVFALHGGHIDPILYGLDNEGIEIFDTRHEQGAALMAEGWGLATAETGVCAVTAGPGFTNALTGVANAAMNRSPMLLLAGRRPASQSDVWTLQDLPQLPMVEPITRWSRSITDGSRAGEYVRTALAEARGAPPGPVYVDVPADVLSRQVSPDVLDGLAPPVCATDPAPDSQVVEQVASRLAAAERPLILAGSGAHWSRAGSAISLLASTFGVPVMTVNAGRGSVADDDPWCVGSAGPMASALPVAATGADLVLCLGVRLGYILLNGLLFGATPLIRVDTDRAELSRNAPGAVEVVADVRSFCESVVKCGANAVPQDRAGWLDQLQEAARVARAGFDELETGPDGGIHPAAVIRAMIDVGGSRASFVTDGGDTMVWGMCRFPAQGPGHLLGTSSYFGALGVGVPYAIAAKLARPDDPCLLWVGDGAFGFNAIEFDTAVRHGIPIVAVVANNGIWAMSRHAQGIQYGYDHLVASELGDRPYERMVVALGGHGERVDRLDDLRPALERALASGLPACVNVAVDPGVVSPATQMMASTGLS
jgi:acetolactate synthase-1/2/3 large subunit